MSSTTKNQAGRPGSSPRGRPRADELRRQQHTDDRAEVGENSVVLNEAFVSVLNRRRGASRERSTGRRRPGPAWTKTCVLLRKERLLIGGRRGGTAATAALFTPAEAHRHRGGSRACCRPTPANPKVTGHTPALETFRHRGHWSWYGTKHSGRSIPPCLGTAGILPVSLGAAWPPLTCARARSSRRRPLLLPCQRSCRFPYRGPYREGVVPLLGAPDARRIRRPRTR